MTVTRSEILTGINRPEPYILAIVEVEDGQAQASRERAGLEGDPCHV